MRMKTPIRFNNKGNEIITWCLFDVRSCILLCNHCHYTCCCWCLLHHIYASRVNDDNVHQSMEIVFNNKNIHLLLGVVKEKVGNLPLNMCFAFQNNNTKISRNVLWVIVCSFPQGHWSKLILKLSMVWSHWHCERCTIIRCGKPRWIHNVVRKWADDKRNVGVVGWINNQALAPGRTHEQRCVHVMFKGMFIKRETNSCLCK